MKIGKISINTSTFGQFSNEPLKKLIEFGFEIKKNNKGRKLSEKENLDQLIDCVGVIAGTEIYSDNVITKQKNLKIISRLGVGIDNIDLNSIKKNKINLLCTNTSPSIAVAELALGLILDLNRKISLQNNNMKIKKWSKNMGTLLSNKTLGIIGLGNVGKKLIEITRGFNLKYLFYDPMIEKINKKSSNLNIVKCSLNQLLVESDFVSIHTSLNNETYEMFDYDKFKLMKPNSILINTSRGEIIKEKDLEKSLKENLLGGVGLDVFSEEPYFGNLISYNQVVTTPHIGSYAKEIRMKMELEAANNIINFFKEG